MRSTPERSFHRFTTPAANPTVLAELRRAIHSVLPGSRSPCQSSHLHALASRIGEFLRHELQRGMTMHYAREHRTRYGMMNGQLGGPAT